MNIDITIVADQEAFLVDAPTPQASPRRWIQAKHRNWSCLLRNTRHTPVNPASVTNVLTAASNPRADLELLAMLARDIRPEVRATAAANPTLGGCYAGDNPTNGDNQSPQQLPNHSTFVQERNDDIPHGNEPTKDG